MNDLPGTLDYLLRGARHVATLVTGRISHANVQITNRCNMRCGFCTFPERAKAPREELTLAQWRTVARKLAREGSVLVSIEGGEPTMREDVAAIVGAFAEHHHPFLYTNGWFVTDALARDLWKARLVQVGVSLDYATPGRHDASRRLPGAFERACAALERLAATAPRGGRQVHVLTILLDDNLDELEPLLELSRKIGVRHMVTLLSTFGIYRSARAQQPPTEPVSKRLFALKEKHAHLMLFRSYVRGIDRFLEGNAPPCGAGLHSLNIDHQGDASSCIELAETKVANLLRESWPVVKRKLAAFDEPRRCQKCWTLCRGTSEAMAGAPKLEDWRDFLFDHVI